MKRPAVISAIAFICLAPHVRAQDFKAYQNYDFVAGEKVLFEDDFRADTDGEFPAHWKLVSGQGVVNKFNGEPVFALTDGNYAVVEPRMKVKSYLTDPFTIEFDFFPKAGGFEKLIVFLKNADDEERRVGFGYDVWTEALEHDLTASYPGSSEDFKDKWHHVAMIFKNKQVKCYEDQFRVLVVPDFDFAPQSASFGGIGDGANPLIFKNVRIASGGGMNTLDALTKDGKYITHGILFDVSQATVKPQSMGAISEVVKALKANPALKVEIGGHTDADGDAAKNMTLSQARADAVKKIMVDQGIDAARLTTKGYGASKPIDKNDSPEGKANNRRVEFTKVG